MAHDTEPLVAPWEIHKPPPRFEDVISWRCTLTPIFPSTWPILPNYTWRGWWGDNPPFHTPVFVLTHHPRPSIVMEGGTVFHFVADGIHAALTRATEAANGKDVRLGGGVATIRQYLSASLIDEIHLAIAPVLLGSGESLLAGIDALKLGLQCTEHVASASVTHVVLTRRT